MDLVHEQDGAQPAHDEALLGGVDLATQIGHRAADGRDLHESGFGGLGDHVGQRRLPRARRPEQNDRAEAIVLDGGPKPAALAHSLALTHYLIQRARPHAHRQRRHSAALVVFHSSK